MKKDIKKLIRGFKRGKYNKKVTIGLICAALCLGIILYKSYFAKAYPGEWDRYIQNSGIYNDILNSEKSKMDLIDGATFYTLVHNPSTDAYSSDEEKTYYYGHGKNFEYTNTTIDATNKWKSRWFLSPYGPFLDYIQNKGNAQSNSIAFAQQGSLYKNSENIYIAQDVEDFADAKTLASLIFDKNISAIPPLLINSDPNTLSDNIKNEARSNNTKNLVVLGGSQIYKTMFSIGEDFNTVRVGGANRNDTYNLLNITEQNKSGIYSLSTKPTTDSNGVVCDIKTDKIDEITKYKIKSYLDENTQEGFLNAANLVLDNIQYGKTDNITANGYQVLIGCKISADSTNSKFLKVYYLKNIAGYQYGVYQAIGKDYFTSTPTPTIGNITATLNAPTRVFCGDDVNMEGTGTAKDPDKSISKLSGNIWVNNTERTGVNGVNPSADGIATWDLTKDTSTTKNVSFDNHSSPVWFSETGIYHANSAVKDSSSNSAKSDIKSITAVYPYPIVRINKTGTEKQNRKLTVDVSTSDGGCNTKNGNERWPIDWTSAKWQIKALGSTSMNDLRIQTHVAGTANGTILYDPSRGITDLSKLNGVQTFDILAKNPGQYQFTCTLTSNCTFNSSLHFSNTNNMIVNILEDAVPICKFWAPGSEYRDPNDKNVDGFAQGPLIGIDDGSEQNGSYSTDGDTIAKRLWLASLDENCNGSYEDDKWYIYKPSSKTLDKFGTYDQAINADINSYDCGNEINISPKVTHVGKWEIGLIVQEEFGQDYIPQFVTPNDRKIGQ